MLTHKEPTNSHAHTPSLSSSLYSFLSILPRLTHPSHTPSHAGTCNSSQWLTASMWSLWGSEHDFLTYGSSAAFLVIWQETESLLAYVKGGLSGCNICARACACMSSVCWCEVLVESARHPVFFTFSHEHTQGTTLIIQQPTHTVDWFGSLGEVVGELDLIEFLLQVSIDPIQYQHGFSGLQRHSQYAPLRKSVVQYHDFNGASPAQSISSNRCGLKDSFKLIVI